MPPKTGIAHRENFTRPWHINYCPQSRFCFAALYLRAKTIVRFISNATFLLPVTHSLSPNVATRTQLKSMENSSLHADNQLRKTEGLAFNKALWQKHLSPGTSVLMQYKRRHISTSGLMQNAAKRAQLGKYSYDHGSLIIVHCLVFALRRWISGQKHLWFNLSDAILPVPRTSSPNVHSLSLLRILL